MAVAGGGGGVAAMEWMCCGEVERDRRETGDKHEEARECQHLPTGAWVVVYAVQEWVWFVGRGTRCAVIMGGGQLHETHHICSCSLVCLAFISSWQLHTVLLMCSILSTVLC